jgi:hypothetical protein
MCRIHSAADLEDCGILLADIARAGGYGVFEGFREVSHLIGTYGIEPFVEIARVSGGNTSEVFRYGIPKVSHRFGDIFANRENVIADLRRIRSQLREPVEYYERGRSALYIASSTRDASSISSILTAEYDRTFASFPGSPTILDRFGSSSESLFLPSRRMGTSMWISMSSAFCSHSPLCRSPGLATSTRHFGTVNARCSAFATDTVDFPHCRVQFKIPRLDVDRSTAHCGSSGSSPNRPRANSTASGADAGTCAFSGVPAIRGLNTRGTTETYRPTPQPAQNVGAPLNPIALYPKINRQFL